MKKLISVLLVLALALSVCAPVLAEQEYEATLMSSLKVTVEEATAEEDTCAMVMSVMMVDLVLVEAEVGTIAQTGTAYMKGENNCIEAFILCDDGKYVSASYNADTKKYTYSGIVSELPDVSAFKTVSMETVYQDVLYIISMLLGEDE